MIITQLRNKENLLGTIKTKQILGINHKMLKLHCSHLFFSYLFLHCSFTLENCRNHYWLAFQWDKLGWHWFSPFHAVSDNEKFQRMWWDTQMFTWWSDSNTCKSVERYSLCFSALGEPDAAARNEIRCAAVTSWCRRMVSSSFASLLKSLECQMSTFTMTLM